MESIQFLITGFAAALQPTNLLFAVIGCFLGTLIGVLPGIGPAAGTAMLIPVTFALEPTPAIIMLTAIYYGSMYGGTITAVLINVPGEAASAITCLDGYQMARKGRAGAALAVAAVGSFIGGTFAMAGLVFLALPMTALGLRFGPPEFFALMVMGLTLVAGMAGRSMVRALVSACIGLLIGMVGIDPVGGRPRFTFGQEELLSGLQIVPVVMGLFGVGEILLNAESGITRAFAAKVKDFFPTSADMRESAGSIVRGTLIGFLLGIIPGVGAIVTTFVSYVIERKVSKTPEKFGTGMIQGVAGPETANNAHHIAALIPLFTLGIPTSATIAIIMGAFMMNGLVPGPTLFTEHANFAWAVIASLYISNVILLIMNLPMIPLWVVLLKIPYEILFAVILAFCVLGAYSLDNSTFDIAVMIGFGVVGYLAKKFDFPLGPAVLTMILGPLMENALRQSLEMSDGNFAIFMDRPIAAGLLLVAAVSLVASTLRVFSAVKEAN